MYIVTTKIFDYDGTYTTTGQHAFADDVAAVKYGQWLLDTYPLGKGNLQMQELTITRPNGFLVLNVLA